MLAGALILAGLPLFALPTWAAPALAHADPISLVKRAEGHEVVELFSKRQSNYPPPNQVPNDSQIPKAWLDKLATINIPSNIPVSTGAPLPVYAGRDKTDPSICSFTYQCQGSEDLYAPPAGRISFTFDDGVSGGSDSLLGYLTEQNSMGKATHFMIGSYIYNDQNKFKAVAGGGAHIGVHTWSHQYMTTLTNNQVVGELGWTMQIISDLNGGRVPRYWRPPFGDVDNRVRAIAKGVFGLETVIWNHDTGDWNLDQPGSSYNQANIVSTYTGWLNDKSQGLNVLEHEVRPSQIEVFKIIFQRAQQMGWQVGNVADMWGKPWYQNAANKDSTVTPMSVGGGAVSMASGSATASASSSSGNSSSTSSSMSASSSAINSTSTTIRSSTSAPISTSSTPAVTSQNAAVSPSASKVSGAGLGVKVVGWGMIIPAFGMVLAMV